MIRAFALAEYDEAMDFMGKDLIGLSGARREKVRALIPGFAEASAMRKRWGFQKKLRA